MYSRSRRRLFFCYIVATVLSSSTIIRYVRPATATDTRPGANKDNKNLNKGPSKRIVGGKDALEDRYPYFVSLQENLNGIHKCGGSLVAPDIIMTAAHCASKVKYAQVGKYYLNSVVGNTNSNSTTAEENKNVTGTISSSISDYETFEVLNMTSHPLYDSGYSFSHDVLLLKLDRISKKQYIRINQNSNIPITSTITSTDITRDNNDKQLIVMGIGSLSFSKFGSSPQVLQETSLSFIPNRICRRSKDPDVEDNYQDLISDDMLCAFENSQDACQGDSGGPLILKGDSTSNDILVGLVSWGFGCAHPSFPGVYSRISYHSDWSIGTICQISSKPPIEYDCANVKAPSEEKSVPITIIIQFDDHPGEISWAIEEEQTGSPLVNVTEDMNNAEAQSRSQETVFLPPGSNVTFKIRDRYGDGLCCNTPGDYRVVLGRNAAGKVLAYGGGDFGREKSHAFQVPVDFVDEREKLLVVEDGQIYLTTVIQLDSFPEEIGWRIDRLGVEVDEVMRIPAGIYTIPKMTVIRTVVLKKDELYYFSIYDIIGDGIEAGYVKLFLGTTDITDSSRIIFESDGNFHSGVDHTFYAAFPSTVLLPPSNVYTYLTLVTRMDLYPGEISFQLRMDNSDKTSINREEDRNDTIVFFRPPRYYKDRVNEVVTERIPIPQTAPGDIRQFSFIIADRAGDGLCCSWDGELETGYTLYEGDPSNDNIIVNSKFESVGREIQIFHLNGDDIEHTIPNGEKIEEQRVQIKVTIMLDFYPDETGFYITDSSGRRVVFVPPGTFTDPNGIVEKIITLRTGLYKFALIDSFGDGMNRGAGAYRLDLLGDDKRPSLLTGTGNFDGKESHTFLLEGDEAQCPLQINLRTGGKPTDFGWSIYRLDLVESVASVASKSKGEYRLAYEEVSESLMVTRGALYRIVFENSYSGINGKIRINIRGSNTNLSKSIEFTVDPVDARYSQRWQVKMYAGIPLVLTENNAKRLTLQIHPDHFPDQIEWILLSNPNNNNSTTKLPSTSYRVWEDSKIIAYGASALNRVIPEGELYYETIMVPQSNENQRKYALIVTGTGNDNKSCCSFEKVEPLQLYDGAIDDDSLLSLEKFEREDGLVVFFSLIDSGSASFQSSIQYGYRVSSVVTLLGFVVLLL